MQMTFTFPKRDAELLTFLVNFKDLIGAAPTDYGITTAQAAELASAVLGYQGELLACDPAVRNQTAVMSKNAAKRSVMAMAYDLAMAIAAQPAISPPAKLALGIKARATRSRIGPPTVRPGITIASVAGRTVTVRIHDSASSNARGRVRGAVGAQVYTYVGASYPSDPTLWQFGGLATRAAYDVTFADTVAGGTQVWLCAAWVNHRGDAGPSSVPVQTSLAGGNVSTVTTTLRVAA